MEVKNLDAAYFRQHPERLPEFYQPVIRKAVHFFLNSGYLHPDDMDDIAQDISLGIFERRDHILSQYNERASFPTYMNAVIFNHCRHVIRLKKYRKMERMLPAYDHLFPSQPGNAPIIKDEWKKLETIFSLFDRKKNKLILTLLLCFRIPVSHSYLLSLFPDASMEEVEDILELNPTVSPQANDKEIYPVLIRLFNRVENKNNTPDSLRKWINAKIDEIVELMNAPPGNCRYDPETIQILVEHYFIKNHD